MMLGATLGDLDLSKLSACSCGRNEAALYFCTRYPNTCKRKIAQKEGQEPEYVEQLVYCMLCGTDEDSCHDHKQTIVNVRCQQTHQEYGQVYNSIQQLHQKTEENVALYKPILKWAAEGAKTVNDGATPSNLRNLEKDYSLVKSTQSKASEIMDKFDNSMTTFNI